MKNPKDLVSAIQFLNKFKHIQRLSLIDKKGRRESDAEHTWHLVVTMWMLSETYEKNVDLNKAIRMALVHDLPEMLAGDVFAHDSGLAKEQKKAKEVKALDEIISKLPEQFGKEVKELWYEYEERTSDEARFVWLVDKIMPRIQQVLTEGDFSDELEYDKQLDAEQMKKMSDMSNLFKELLENLYK